MTNTKNIVAVSILVLVLIVCILFGAKLPFSNGWDFRNNLWGPAHLLLHNQSPYAVSLLFENSNAVWLPMLIGLLFPLGWLSQGQATGIWMVVNIAALFIVCWLVARTTRPSLKTFALTATCVLVFPASVTHLLQGQFTLIAVLLLWLAAQDDRGGNYLLKGLLIAVALTKPQLSLFVLPGLVLARARIGGLKAASALVGSTVLWVLLLLLPLWLIYPGWTADFIAALLRNQVSWAQPSSYTVLQLWLGSAGLLIWGTLAAGFFVLNAWVWLNRRPEIAVIWSLAFTALASPYIWSYDFVLLAPLAIHTAFRARWLTAKMAMAIGYALSWGAVVWTRLNTDNADWRFWWAPWLLVAVFCVAVAANRKELLKGQLSQKENTNLET